MILEINSINFLIKFSQVQISQLNLKVTFLILKFYVLLYN
jgi:hypothetical protein